MFQALGRCTSSTQAGHNLNQFETFLHLHLSSHIFTIRISLIIFHGFHRDCQNCACGNILFSRSSLFWFSTFNFLPEFSEQALGDDSALTKTKTVMYIQHRTSGERNTVWMGWMDQPWSLKPDGIHICHCLLPAMASHGNCCPSDVVLGVDHAAKKSRRIVSSRQIASTSLNKGRSWAPRSMRSPTLETSKFLDHMMIYDVIWTPPRVPYASRMMVMRIRGGTISGTSVIPPFDSFQHVILKGPSWLSGMFWLVLAA